MSRGGSSPLRRTFESPAPSGAFVVVGSVGVGQPARAGPISTPENRSGGGAFGDIHPVGGISRRLAPASSGKGPLHAPLPGHLCRPFEPLAHPGAVHPRRR